MEKKHSKMLGRILDIGFIFAIVFFLAIGAIKTYFLPKNVNYYENRTANQMPGVGDLKDGSFQDDVEAAFSDQVFLAQRMEASYHFVNNSLQMRLISPFLKGEDAGYVKVLGMRTFGGGHLVYQTRDLDALKDLLDAYIANANQIMEQHPELDFYNFYVEKETDLNLETGEKVPIADYLSARLHFPEGHFGIFRINDFATFDQEFYKTDHHWNCYGSYRGYCQLLSMLAPDDQPLKPVEEVVISNSFSGSKASTIGAKKLFAEPFPVYRFDYPTMDISINGKPVTDYGNQEKYFNGTATAPVTYGMFYGPDSGEIIFDTHQPEKENLLVFGESYDNAILELLAASFNQTYSIDLRNYERECGETFHLADYVEEHQITKVLFMGNVDFFLMTEFLVED